MADAKYFRVVGRWRGFTKDDKSDPDEYPQFKGVSGGVTITARTSKNRPVIKAAELDPNATLISLWPMEVKLDDGRLKIFADSEDPSFDQPDVLLVANCPALGLDEGEQLIYTFTPHDVTANGQRQSLPSFSFLAPFIAEDHDDEVDGEITVDWTRVEWLATSQAAPGGGSLVRNVPDSVQLNADSALEFYNGDVIIGGPVDISDLVWKGPVSGITDSGAAGRAVVQSDTADQVLTAAGGSASGKTVFKGTPSEARAAIGAGTSSLALGSSGSTAKPGNWVPASADISDASASGATVLTGTPEQGRAALGVDAQIQATFDPNDIGFDVILLAGQSNEVGYGLTFDANIDTADPRVWQWPGSGSYVGQIIAANDPLFHAQPQSAGRVGHAMAFARHYVRSIPINRQVLLVPTAWGGTGFTTSSAVSPPVGFTTQEGGSWDPANGSGGVSRYDYAIAQANAAIASGPNNRLVAVVWLQGEADRALSTAQYAAKLDALIDGFRASITGASTVPFLVGQMLPDSFATDALAVNIDAAHIDTPRRKTRTGFFYGPLGYAGDSQHYSAAGQRVLAKAVYPALVRAKANVLGVAPLVPTGLTVTQSGTSVIAAWDQQAGRVTNFVVEYTTNGTTWTSVSRPKPIDVKHTITGLTLGSTVQVRVSATNEQGTSAPCAGVSRPMVNLPGQPTGLAVGTTTSFTAPLSWTAGSGATGYLIEYKLSAASTWTAGPTVTGTSTTLSGLPAASNLDFRVTAVNAAGSSSPSSTVSGSTQPLTPLRTQVGVAFSAAYSLRNLDSAYSGSAIRVRRSSDSTEQDIGFTLGDLDTAALLTFCGAGDGFITKWYDQSGNGKDLVQATTSRQPKIVAAGALNKIDSIHPAALFDGTANILATASTIGAYAAGSSSLLAVTKGPSTPFATVFNEASTVGGQLGGYMMLIEANSTPAKWQLRSYDNGSIAQLNVVGAGANAFDGNIHQQTLVDSGTSISSWVDAVSAIPATTVTRGGTLTLNTFAIGGRISAGSFSAFFPGNIAEVVVFNTALTSTQRQNGELNQKTYYATP